MTPKRILTALALVGLMLSAGARTAADFFVAAPPEVLRSIDTITRLDMLDYYRSGISTASSNLYDGHCRVTDEQERVIAFEPTSTSESRLALLVSPKNDTTLCLIETVHIPMPDSRITFYDTDFRPLKKAPLNEPRLADWVTDKRYIDQVAEQIPFITAQYDYHPATNTLTITRTIDRYYASDDVPAALQYVKKSLQYVWDGKRFKEVKQ